ncbi:MAG: DUF2851 family protein [Cytophagaceae bacterium]
MKEDVLWVLWQYLYFDTTQLFTTEGQPLYLKSNGHKHSNSGPDFTEASILLDGIHWKGDVEIHVKSSDWYKHKHDTDPAYESVILHVVYNHDRVVYRTDGTQIPTLELKSYVPQSFWTKYESIIHSNTSIACASLSHELIPIRWQQMKDRVLIERLEQKSKQWIPEFLQHPDWKNIAFQLLAKGFGSNLNEDIFLSVAQKIDVHLLSKLSYEPVKVEALMMGMSGWLQDKQLQDEYYLKLKKEFEYLRHTYSLEEGVDEHEWKFLRTRPANFPTLRMAQFISLIQQANWFENIFQENIALLKQYFKTTVAHDYWKYHTHFGRESHLNPLQIGKDFVELIIINSVIPFMTLQAMYYKEDVIWDKIFKILEQLPAEKNKYTRLWSDIGIPVQNAADSQSLLQLYKQYCSEKKCLSCSIGIQLLKR